jgi:predicted RNase H-like HicB family nuclease
VRYLVVLEEGATSWGASVPDLPGCVAVGASCEEALVLIREAIPVHLEGLRAAGEDIPASGAARSELVSVDAARYAEVLERLLQHLEDSLACEQALAERAHAIPVDELRARVVTAGLAVSGVDAAITAAREEGEQTVPWDDLRGMLAGLRREGISAVDELIAERRAEPSREDTEDASH